MRKRLPCGCAFLPGISIDGLCRLREAEDDPGARRILDACIARKRGLSLRGIALDACASRETIRSWLLRAQEEGRASLCNAAGRGPAPRLAAAHLAKLRAELAADMQNRSPAAPRWTGKTLAAHVMQKYGAQYAERTMQALLRDVRLGSGSQNRGGRTGLPEPAALPCTAFKDEPEPPICEIITDEHGHARFRCSDPSPKRAVDWCSP